MSKTILYAEDDGFDIFFCRDSLKKLAPDLDVRFVQDGGVALEWLNGEGVYADRAAYPLPSLLVTDLKMPRLNGLELLDWVRAQPGLKKMSVVIHSSSGTTKQINRWRELGMTQYILKDANCLGLIQYLRDFVAGKA